MVNTIVRRNLLDNLLGGIPIEALAPLAKNAIDDSEPPLTSGEAWEAIPRLQDESIAAFKQRRARQDWRSLPLRRGTELVEKMNR